jgi:lipid-A-disaccharide synthase
VLIDYPGFNLRIAEWAKQQRLKIVFYISPQVWAWKQNRVKIIKQCVNRMIVILPFEKEFYLRWNYSVDYVGHPLSQVVDEFLSQNTIVIENLIPSCDKHNPKGIIALLPGSRKQEIRIKLPLMLNAARHFPAFHFVIAKAPSIEQAFYDELYSGNSNVSVVENKTYALLTVATAALVTSGTATLETALFGVPQVICYKGSKISYVIAKRLVKIKFIGLVNLIMDKEVVKELIQDELTEENIVHELNSIINDPRKIAQIKEDYHSLRTLLKKGGNASEKAAEIVIETARS